MTAEQAQQLVEQMRAQQAQHTAMMEELDFSRQREQAATQAAAELVRWADFRQEMMPCTRAFKACAD